jgi:hypothetical protein
MMCGRLLRRHPVVLAAMLGAFASSIPSGAEEVSEWQPLYAGGPDLKGWKEVGGGKWSVENGEIVGKTGDGRYGWLVTDKEYADFVLELECKAADLGNSGIQFRSHVINGTMYGWQADFDPGLGEKHNGVYDEGGKRGWIAIPKGDAVNAVKPKDWNRYRISAVGDHVQVWINGVNTADFHDPQFTRGVIALQVHSGKEPPINVRWRNIRIRTLDENKGFEPLFDGKSLAGWHVAGKEKWIAENGQIIAQCKQNAAYCYLLSDKQYGDFYVKLEFLCDSQTGNSGFFFHSTIAGVDINGPQAEISSKPGEHTGLIYGPAGRGWLNINQWDPLKDAMYRVKEWNELEVQSVGPHIIVHLNGWPISDLVDEKLPRKGMFALQMHSGEAMKIRFKDAYYRPMTPADKPLKGE